MSDMLNEKFEEFLSGQQVVMEAGADPMPRVTASVIPGTGSDPSAISGDPQQNGSGKDPMPTVPTSVAPNQSQTDLGGSQSEPLHSNKEEGEENPGAKAAAPVSQDGSVTSPSGKPGDEAGANTLGAEIAYGTKKGPNVSYPIKPAFEELDMSSDISALLEGTELSEEFAEKAKTIFEAAVKAKISEEYDKLVEHFGKELEKQLESANAELSEEVNGTVNYAVTQWREENRVAIDRGIKNEITEDFIAGLKGLFEEHYIAIPDDKVDVVEGMAESIREMEERLDEQVKANVKLQNRLNESAKLNVLSNVSEGLADTQKEKLAALAEGLEYVTEEDFSKKVKTIKESYFKNSVSTPTAEVADETPVEGVGVEVTPAMAQYLTALNRWK